MTSTNPIVNKAITSKNAKFIDAQKVAVRPGDTVIHKAQYASHRNDDDWLDRNADTVREVRGGEVRIGSAADDWMEIKDLMVWTNALVTRNAKFKVGDKVTDGNGVYLITKIDKDWNSYEWKRISGTGDPSYVKGGDMNWANRKMRLVKNYKPTRNAKFKVGDKVKVYHGTKEGKIIRVREGMRGPIYEVQLGTIYGAPKVSGFSEKEMVAANSRACNAKFKVGDKVQVAGIGTAVIKTVDEIKSVVGPRIKYGIDIGGGRIMTVPEKDVVKNAVPVYASHPGPMMGRPSAWEVVEPMAREIKYFLALYREARSGRNKKCAARAILLAGELREYITFQAAGQKALRMAGTTAADVKQKKKELWDMYGFKDYSDLVRNR